MPRGPFSSPSIVLPAKYAPWEKSIVADPMASMGNWLIRSGTWTTFGALGVEQTNGGTDNFATDETVFGLAAVRAIQATINPVTGGASSWSGVAFAGPTGYNSGALSIGLNVTGNTIQYDRNGSGGSTVSYSPFGTLAFGTDYQFAVWEQSGNNTYTYTVYVNGMLITTINEGSSILTGGVGIYCRSSTAWFRNVSTWHIEPSAVLPWGE